ncbi:MAG: 50S ribosomal protein L11 methyltransferase [Pseudomonadota bacterium]
MFKLVASGPREAIEAAGATLAWMDPSPCTAVDTKEESRGHWRLDAYSETEGDAHGAAGIIELVNPELSSRIEAIEPRDWVTMSLEGLPPVRAGRFFVSGQHALTSVSPGRTAVWIEAGPAFGTGHHGTTLGCLLALDRELLKRRPGRVLDLGAGSGVLAIAALKSAADRAVGTDIDAQSVVVAAENASKNQVAAGFRSLKAAGTRHTAVLADAPYQTIFANILMRPLVRLAPEIVRVSAPGALIILSGLLLHQEPLVKRAFTARGLVLDRRIRRDGWLTLVLRKPQTPQDPERRPSAGVRRALGRTHETKLRRERRPSPGSHEPQTPQGGS